MLLNVLKRSIVMASAFTCGSFWARLARGESAVLRFREVIDPLRWRPPIIFLQQCQTLSTGQHIPGTGETATLLQALIHRHRAKPFRFQPPLNPPDGLCAPCSCRVAVPCSRPRQAVCRTPRGICTHGRGECVGVASTDARVVSGRIVTVVTPSLSIPKTFNASS